MMFFSLKFLYINLCILSFLSCLVWSYFRYAFDCVMIVFMLSSYLRYSCATRIVCEGPLFWVLRPSVRDFVRPGVLWSGSLLGDIFCRMAYPLVKVEFYLN